ncbi:MAG: nucleotide exchange factor GrpE [Robiginitomaculum sp.]|nr:MAG: nucleotide exchange factor GrpE [Robiginitomaculum sp.]
MSDNENEIENDATAPQMPDADMDSAEDVLDAQAEAQEPDLREELGKVREQMFRIAAEAENTRKRAAREVTDARKYAVTALARDLLDVADNLSRALGAIPAEARDHASEALGGLIEGVELTDKTLHVALDRHGVRKIDPKGEKFNPNHHQAVAQIPSNAPAGEVVEVIQPGYLLGDRTLRAAMVAISSGQPAVPEDHAAAEAKGDEPGSNIDTTA